MMEKIIRDKYQDVIERTLLYAGKNGTLPKYTTINGKQCLLKDVLDACQRSNNYYKQKGKCAGNVNMNLQEPTPLPAQPTVYKNPRYIPNYKQETGYYCADDMLVECGKELWDIIEKQSVFAKLAGTTTEGTGSNGVISAIISWAKSKGHSVKAYMKNFSDTGWLKVCELVANPDVFLGMHVLYRNHKGWGHWMTPTKITLVYTNGKIDTSKSKIACVDTLNAGSAEVEVTLAEYELWIANTPGNQPSVFIAEKIS